MLRAFISKTSIALSVITCTILFATVTFAQEQIPKVRVKPVEFKNAEIRRIVTGSLRAYQRSDVASQESGLVITAERREGQVVKKGDILAELDARRLKLEVEQAEHDVQIKLATIEQRKAELATYQEELNRRTKSQELAAGAVSKEDIRRAKMVLAVAESAQITAESDYELACARLSLLKVRLDDTVIRAPFNGNIVRKHAETGEWISPGSPIVTLISSGVIEAFFDVSEDFSMQRLRSLKTITVNLKEQNIHVESENIRVVPDVDPRSRRYILIAVLKLKEHFLTPGMSVTATIPTNEKGDYLVIPTDSVMRDSGGEFAYKIGRERDGNSIAVPVSLRVHFAIDDGLCIESSDLREGDLIVVEGNERLRPLSPVIILKSDKS
ncbi:MAG: efflux RND transporter periplasmic adaptor subunit [Candidatus Scalindua sp. SCAELEC01]|nr:efflux RND transporter periplasmic adaptor subunit [Planctomycetota bacterium]RZV91396.1 MAG: efflux RND transporter periplasmic adaptor subunit [Candidatus Scalindua sp. SCAELEC01]